MKPRFAVGVCAFGGPLNAGFVEVHGGTREPQFRNGVNVMTLKDAVERLEELDGEDVIYVRRPWSPAAECQTVRYDPPSHDGRQRDGMDYFLEVGCTPGNAISPTRSSPSYTEDLPRTGRSTQ